MRGLGELLDEEGLVLAHPWITGEFILGGLSSEEERLLERLPHAALVPHEEVLELVRRRRLSRRGIGWVGVNVLASALAASATLWILDLDLARVAAELKAAYHPGPS